MFDKLSAAGSALDWITPLLTFFQDLRNRPSIGYSVPVDCGWSAYAISDLLHDYGVKIWGLAIVKETIIFRVRVPQAAYAQYLFERNGITYHGGVDTAVAVRQDRALPRGTRAPSVPGAPGVGGMPAAHRSATMNSVLDTVVQGSLNKINSVVDKLPGT
jgi:hypothetical protein